MLLNRIIVCTSNDPLLLTKGNEQMNMMAKMMSMPHPVKLAHPGMRPNISGIGVNSHSECIR